MFRDHVRPDSPSNNLSCLFSVDSRFTYLHVLVDQMLVVLDANSSDGNTFRPVALYGSFCKTFLGMSGPSVLMGGWNGILNAHLDCVSPIVRIDGMKKPHKPAQVF